MKYITINNKCVKYARKLTIVQNGTRYVLLSDGSHYLSVYIKNSYGGDDVFYTMPPEQAEVYVGAATKRVREWWAKAILA